MITPAGSVISGRYASNAALVIFADRSDHSIANGELHAHFSLSKGGEYLGLIRPDGVTVADEFAPRFPPQWREVSYGRGRASGNW